MSVPDIAPNTTGKVPTELLDFDPENPRLIEDGIKTYIVLEGKSYEFN